MINVEQDLDYLISFIIILCLKIIINNKYKTHIIMKFGFVFKVWKSSKFID